MDIKSIEIANTERELDKKKKIYNSVKLEKLPDKGARIKQQIEELEASLKSLSLEVSASKNKNEETFNSEHLESQNKSKNSLTCKEDAVSNSHRKVNNDAKEESTFTESKTAITGDCDANKNYVVCTSAIQNKNIKVSTTESSKHFVNSQTLSFSDLAEKAPKVPVNTSSPSFFGYRDKSKKIQLTEAKPLIETQTKKSCNPNFSKGFSVKTNYESVKNLHDSLVTFPNDSIEESEPQNLKSELMMHQKKALAWLIWREQQTPSGGVLADDMGLGKTLTIISLILKQTEKQNFLACESEKNESKGTLIICVASIIHQWKEEIQKHVDKDSLTVEVYHGPKRDRNVKNMMEYDVVLTTYNIVMQEAKLLTSNSKSPLFNIKWERIVLDEAHTIKNHKSQTADAIFHLKAFRKWAVTGTPIHNDFKDMYSLLKFLEFSPFDDYKKFKKIVDDDSEISCQRRDLLVKSMLLRRTKEQVDDEGKPLIKMKNKTIRLCYIELSDQERKIYDKFNEKVNKKLYQYFLKSSKLNSSYSLLVLLLRLQQICCHMSLVKEDVEDSDDIAFDITKNLSSLALDDDSSSASSDSLNVSLDECDVNLSNINVKSSKLEKLFQKLKTISQTSQNKSVIVSQWVSLLNIVAHHLKKENIDYHIIIGSTKAEDRQNAAEDFNKNENGAKIMLLSLKAGGVGLNLIGASNLFLLDLHWNPALEMQACDRIHRVGQDKDVTIYKFVCKNTIEEKILNLQNSKRCLAKNVLKAKSQSTKGLCIEDFKVLFNIN